MMRSLLLIILLIAACPALAAGRPNVILVMTDDQGYGDIAALGNPLLKTPHIDALHAESVRLTDYHTDPTCSPSRAALLTGRSSTRTGVWHTINGRSLMHGDEYTLAEYFKDNGYRTGMFGKWHLGGSGPLRPMDQGFDHCVWSPGGAVNQGGNYLGNDCFDDTYKVNQQWHAFKGYHTDVWFDEAMKFIEDGDQDSDSAKDREKDKPFFVYLPTTAVHDPWNVTDAYAQPYLDAGVPPTMAKFYGMITNIDDNLGRLRAFLEEKGLANNTILIFTTDNGTTAGWIDRERGFPYFNAGMRGWKGSEYEGGHRVPFFLHWPAGGINEGCDIDTLSAHIDIMPTLGELCGLDAVAPAKLRRGPQDGRSLATLMRSKGEAGQSPEPRTLLVHSQRTSRPIKWRQCAVMTEHERLVNGTELYDIVADPGQENDLAADHPDRVAKLRGDYEAWWATLEPVFDEHVRFDLGGVENPTTLMSHDWFMEGGKDSAWHHKHVERNDLIDGPFMVTIVKPGRYRITPMRWPEYVNKPSGCREAMVQVSFPPGPDSPTPIEVRRSLMVDPAKPTTGLELDLPAGPASLTTTLTREDGKTFGGYYVKIEYLGNQESLTQ